MFRVNDSLIIDECATFFIAGTQTMSILLSNALFYITSDTLIRDKIRKEAKDNLGEQRDLESWVKAMEYDALNQEISWQYVSNVV